MSTEHSTDPSAPVDRRTAAAAPSCSCWSRRESLMVAGVAVAGTAGLTACGVEHRAMPSTRQRRVRGAASRGEREPSPQADIPVGGGKVFDALKVVITQPTAGDFKAFSAICTHQGCTVNGVSRTASSSAPATARPSTSRPARSRRARRRRPLPTKSVTVGSDGITVT